MYMAYGYGILCKELIGVNRPINISLFDRRRARFSPGCLGHNTAPCPAYRPPESRIYRRPGGRRAKGGGAVLRERIALLHFQVWTDQPVGGCGNPRNSGAKSALTARQYSFPRNACRQNYPDFDRR